jgi:hypothetical protein
MATSTTSPQHELHLTSPPAQGLDIVEAQQRLNELTYSVGEVEGACDIAMTAAGAFVADRCASSYHNARPKIQDGR